MMLQKIENARMKSIEMNNNKIQKAKKCWAEPLSEMQIGTNRRHLFIDRTGIRHSPTLYSDAPH